MSVIKVFGRQTQLLLPNEIPHVLLQLSNRGMLDTCRAPMLLSKPWIWIVQAELHGVLPVQKGKFQGIQQMALRWPNRLKQAVAVCNGLTMVGKHTVVGVDMERSMFKAVEARFLV